MILVPWTTNTGSTVDDNFGNPIEFSVDYDFLTLPITSIEVGLVYNYNIVVSGSWDNVIEAIVKPNELDFVQNDSNTAILSGVFTEAGSYSVELKSSYSGIEVFQIFTINVTDKYAKDGQDENYNFNNLGEGLLILFEEIS